MRAMSSLNKRRDLTDAERREILRQYDELPKVSQREAAERLKISQPLLCKILKKRNEYEEAAVNNENPSRKRKRCGKDNEVEVALKKWFVQVRSQDARVSGPVLREKAADLAEKLGKENFNPTEGWFHRWKRRENICWKKPHGEVRDADVAGANEWFAQQWPKLIAEYDMDDVYNADECALYFRALPETTYVLKTEKVAGCKIAKERITVLCCASMGGAKKETLLVIGKSKNPRCFKNVRALPVEYHANATAWMTTDIFHAWLTTWDRTLNRNILLLVDNATPHVASTKLNLKHIKTVLLPANTTSLIQPCDQGIINAMKGYYRTEMRRRIIRELDENIMQGSAAEISRATSLLDAVHMLSKAWKLVSPMTIRNCFRKGGFKDDVDGIEDDSDCLPVPPANLSAATFAEWVTIDDNLPTTHILTEEDICAEIKEQGHIENNEATDADEEEQDEPIVFPNQKEIQAALPICFE